MRINPLERRESRFLDSLPGLPDVIHIDTTVKQSLDCMEQLSSEAIWLQAPPGVRNHDTAATAARPPATFGPQARRQARATDSIASHITGITDLIEDTSPDPRPPGTDNHLKKQQGGANLI